ncbi:hypothetical protein L7F22_049005 [Adiantum nelumboides]|nr:hypothetical protein [Adiantum nelumboides]
MQRLTEPSGLMLLTHFELIFTGVSAVYLALKGTVIFEFNGCFGYSVVYMAVRAIYQAQFFLELITTSCCCLYVGSGMLHLWLAGVSPALTKYAESSWPNTFSKSGRAASKLENICNYDRVSGSGGHVGVCREDGVILDFAGSYYVNIYGFAFGAAARYVHFSH